MKPALLLVDLQGDFLDAAGLSPAREPLIHESAGLLQDCRGRNIPVFHVWTTIAGPNGRRLPHWEKMKRPLCLAGTAGHEPPAPLRPAGNEPVIHKTGFNGFAGGALDAALGNIGCDTVVIAGLHLHACVRALATESLERGLRVFVAGDAVAGNDPVLGAATRRWLGERCVEFLSTVEILSRLDGHPPSKLRHYSPRETGRILFEVPIAGAGEIAGATGRAREAWKSWTRRTPGARAEILGRAARGLEAAAPRLARQMAVEIGKPFSHGLEEVRRAAANIRDVIRRAAAFEFLQTGPAGLTRHRPVGVVALISPWNNPVAIPAGKIAPALIYGNTVVWKPAPAATRISAAILRLLRRAGVPAGTVQIVTGGPATAQTLAADANVDAVTLTGSAQAGHVIQEICARRFLPLQAELSGNNAAIVWDDADLPAVAAQIAWGAFGFAGQRCTANRRVIAPAGRLEKLRRALNSAAGKLRWGDPLEQSTDIGPVIHTGKRDEHLALIQAAAGSGAARWTDFPFEGRAREPWIRAGAYASPAIVRCDDPEHLLVREETMSPLLVVQPAADFEEALRLCNGVRQGLAAALFAHSAALQRKFLAETRAGILKINSTTAGVDVTLPFGGWKMSAAGPPEHGDGDRLFYTRMQAVYGAGTQK